MKQKPHSESKSNVTPFTVLAYVFCTIQPYAHLLYVQRLIPHQACLRLVKFTSAVGLLEQRKLSKTVEKLRFKTYTFHSPEKEREAHSSPFRRAKALYACKAEHDSELSFTAGAVFDNGEYPSVVNTNKTHKSMGGDSEGQEAV
ncbi:Rho GTPase-activating protein 26 [Varanus komodoensis]|nr:Rho GTPase-activating protein 26 [Varanus komodoensis]